MTPLYQEVLIQTFYLCWSRNPKKYFEGHFQWQLYNNDNNPERGVFFHSNFFTGEPSWKSTSIFRVWNPVDSLGYPVWHQISQKMNLIITVNYYLQSHKLGVCCSNFFPKRIQLILLFKVNENALAILKGSKEVILFFE